MDKDKVKDSSEPLERLDVRVQEVTVKREADTDTIKVHALYYPHSCVRFIGFGSVCARGIVTVLRSERPMSVV